LHGRAVQHPKWRWLTWRKQLWSAHVDLRDRRASPDRKDIRGCLALKASPVLKARAARQECKERRALGELVASQDRKARQDRRARAASPGRRARCLRSSR
jgi:hypothetical protein